MSDALVGQLIMLVVAPLVVGFGVRVGGFDWLGIAPSWRNTFIAAGIFFGTHLMCIPAVVRWLPI